MKQIRKRIVILGISVLILVLLGCVGAIREIIKTVEQVTDTAHIVKKNRSDQKEKKVFEVYKRDVYQKSFFTLNEAVEYGKKYKSIYVKEKGQEAWIWDNYKPFIVYRDEQYDRDFDLFCDAVYYAKKRHSRMIYFQHKNNLIWSYLQVPKQNSKIDVPLILQNPELPRGCEVTSAAMLLQYAGISVDKMTLAKQIKKDPTPYERKNGRILFGNPNSGFVGDMYSLKKPGFGVYHGPVKELMERYLPGQIIDVTGSEFEDLLYLLSQQKPIWIIINTTYKKLRENQFQTWHTPTGEVKITFKQHSVLVTGYDEQYVYFNDPLTNQKNRKVSRYLFQEAWEQMGRQAITYDHVIE
jgi:uncharacterized protein YvpB